MIPLATGFERFEFPLYHSHLNSHWSSVSSRTNSRCPCSFFVLPSVFSKTKVNQASLQFLNLQPRSPTPFLESEVTYLLPYTVLSLISSHKLVYCFNTWEMDQTWWVIRLYLICFAETCQTDIDKQKKPSILPLRNTKGNTIRTVHNTPFQTLQTFLSSSEDMITQANWENFPRKFHFRHQ